MEIRSRLIWGLAKIAKAPEGCEYPWWLRVIHCALFPIRHIVWSARNGIYDFQSDSMMVGGRRVSRSLLRDIAFGDGKWWFRFERTDLGLMVERRPAEGVK